MSAPSHRVGIDVGGTFTDVVTAADGSLAVTKVPSTPDAPDEGVADGLEHAVADGPLLPEAVDFIAHGTTVGTNAVLERDWADTALVTTAGFRDVLEIGRQARPALYDLQAEKPAPIVPRDRRFEVSERLDERGRVVEALSPDTVDAAVAAIRGTDVESVAISLLFSFEHDDHERELAAAIEQECGVDVSRSSAVLPEIREYERTLATALNAALKPVMDRYIGRLEGRLDEIGVPADLRIMQSNGGITGAQTARIRPVNTLLSGPAAGVQGAAHVAALGGYDDIIAMDMGGTSCDVSLVEDGDPLVSTEVEVGDYPVSVPMTEVHTIGAGGGSIAWLDEGGALRVGPRSAGADPGPICYGRGGTAPTVTDAHVALGRIDPDGFLSDALDPAPEAARDGIREMVAEPLDRSVEDAAAGILEVANANMERALRVVSVERGHDPRTFALVAFGGAGPLHAPSIARSLDIPRVLVPRTAGVLSALGLLITDLVHEFSTSRVRPWAEVDPEALESEFAAFAEEGRDRLRGEGLAAEAIAIDRALEMRYRGQSYTLRVPAPGSLDAATMDRVVERFHDRHETRYGHASPDEPVELVTVRLRASGDVSPPDLRMDDPGDGTAEPVARRPVRFGERGRETAIYDRPRLGPGAVFDGPAIVEGPESTILVHPGQTAEVDPYGTVVIHTHGGEDE